MSKEQRKPIIGQTLGTCGGRPRIDGTRIAVQNVVEAYYGFLRDTFINNYVQEHLHLKYHEVEAALNYYDDHRDELDRAIAEDRELGREHGQILT